MTNGADCLIALQYIGYLGIKTAILQLLMNTLIIYAQANKA